MASHDPLLLEVRPSATHASEPGPEDQPSSPPSAPLDGPGAPAEAAGAGAVAAEPGVLAKAPRAADEEEPCCRICLESEDSQENPLISPCRCSGSMRYVHRNCLDEWRVSCFNPKALVSCTTCHTKFRMRYDGPDAALARASGGRWWVRFARDVAWFAGVRVAVFLATVIAVGFWPQLLLGAGAQMLHPNPLVAHVLCGTGTTLAVLGTVAILQLPGLWHTGEGFRLIFDVWCPRRGGGGKSSGVEILLVILIVIGLACCLFYILRGIYHIFNEGRHEVVRAVRGANQQVRRRIVKEYVVLGLGAEDSQGAGAAERGALGDAVVVKESSRLSGW